MARLHLLPVLLLAVAESVLCALYTDPSDLPKTNYDFIVVGAGTAGNVIASRLTENPFVSVLVVEAGVLPDVNPMDQIPFFGSTLSPNTSLTWNYTTTPQVGLENRAIPYPRGRTLGGSSTINYLIWTRGSEDDYNRFAEVSGDEGWSFTNMINYLKKSEHLVPSTDQHNTTGEVNPAVHGYGGPIQISLGGVSAAPDQKFIGSTQQFPDEFPFNLDMNSGTPLGLGWTQNSVDADGRRSSSWTAYLDPASNRSNLDILIQTQATKLISHGTKQGLPIFNSVEISQGPKSKTYTVSAGKEVILSAGSINTPQLLILSGLGDSNALEKLGIKTIVDLPEVGQNLVDHPLLTAHWTVNNPDTIDTIARNVTLTEDLLVQWNTTGTGQFTDPGANQIAWVRLPENSTVLKGGDPSAGPHSAHVELLPVNGFATFTGAPNPTTGNWLSIILAVVSPTSRGSVTLASSNPFEDPIINPGLLSTNDDLLMMVQAIKDAQKLVSSTSFDGYIISQIDPPVNATTDSALEAFARQQTTTVFHPVGTARMGNGSGQSVVTSQLLVRGTSGLRIVDASVFPFIPSAHPQAVVYAVAERAANLIKETWSLF